jgi:hypothetical protein
MEPGKKKISAANPITELVTATASTRTLISHYSPPFIPPPNPKNKILPNEPIFIFASTLPINHLHPNSLKPPSKRTHFVTPKPRKDRSLRQVGPGAPSTSSASCYPQFASAITNPQPATYQIFPKKHQPIPTYSGGHPPRTLAVGLWTLDCVSSPRRLHNEVSKLFTIMDSLVSVGCEQTDSCWRGTAFGR